MSFTAILSYGITLLPLHLAELYLAPEHVLQVFLSGGAGGSPLKSIVIGGLQYNIPQNKHI